MNTYGGGFGLGLAFGAKQIDERICEFIMLEITHEIFDATPVMFGTIKEDVTKFLDECIRDFWAKIAARQLGDRTLSHQGF